MVRSLGFLKNDEITKGVLSSEASSEERNTRLNLKRKEFSPKAEKQELEGLTSALAAVESGAQACKPWPEGLTKIQNRRPQVLGKNRACLRTSIPKGGRKLTSQTSEKNNAYWGANLKLIMISLVIWAVASFGLGIILRPMLSSISVGGTDLGFWFAQQGSIIIFLALIFFYAWRMNKLDQQHGVDEE